MAVRKILQESLPYKLVFPGIKRDPTQWNKSYFKVLRDDPSDIHPTLLAAGATGAVIGARFDGLLYDDPHDEKNVDKSWKRAKVWDNYNNSLNTRVVDHGWQVFIGTRWADDDFIGRLSKSGLILPENVVFMPALNKKGESYWPELYPLYSEIRDEDGNVIREASKLWSVREKTPDVFYLQYMGDTTGGETATIRKIVTYDERITIERGTTETGFPYVKVWKGNDYKQGDRDQRALLIGIGFDTALKKGKENDYTVGYVGGLDRDGNIWLLDRVKGRFGTPELVEEIKRLYEKWMPYNIWIEDSAQGTPAVQTLQAELPFLPTETVPIAQGGSYARANSLTPYLHKGQIKFPVLNDWYEDTRYQLMHFGHTEHDDDVDALYVLCNSLFYVRHPGAYNNRPSIGISMQ
jgi:predicted phage terminase large subunit-like protein